MLTHAPILAFSDSSLPFTLCTDASALGIGAVLVQTEESKRPHVIAYARRVLIASESKCSVTHLEALAVVWALKHLKDIIFGYPITVWALKHLKDIIFGYPITVYTDHTAVTQLIHGKNHTGHLDRWYLTI